jgi:hypothetical protein
MYSFCRASNEYKAFTNLPQITPNWVSKKSLDAHTSCHEWIPDNQNSLQFHSAPNWETTIFTTWGSLLEPGLDWIAWALATQMCKILVWQTCHKMIASCVFLDDSHIRMAKLRPWVNLQFAQVLSSVSCEVVRAIKTEHSHWLFLGPSTLVSMFTKRRNCKTIVQ